MGTLKNALMNFKIKYCVIVLFVVAFFIHSCKKEKEKEITQRNRPPVANAGPDIIIGQVTCVSLRSTRLDGSQSYDPDNDGITYHWTKISGPNHGYLLSIASHTAVYYDIRPGLYVFELQ